MLVVKEEFNELLEMQQALDAAILEEKGLTLDGTYRRRIVAALVELGEFANEERFFKFWSNKEPSEKSIRLEEYVDILHFLLSALYMKGYRYENLSIVGKQEDDFLDVWLRVVSETLWLGHPNPDVDPVTSVDFGRLFSWYFRLGDLAGFTWAEVVEEYKKKNAVNYERLKSGY